MTKDEELAMDLALRSLKELVPDESDYAPAIQGQRKRQEKAITAIKQARSAPVQEPVAWVRLEAWQSGAEWPDDCFTGIPADGLTPLYTTPPAAPVQEPVHQWRQKHSPYWYDGYPDNDDGGGPYETRILYTTPPAQPAPVQEPVALTDDEIWKFWWNKPEVPEGEDDSMEAQFVFACREAIKAATQRQWVGLTDEKIDELMYRFTGYELLYAIQAELKEKNT